MKFKTRKQLKEELAEANSDALYYKNKLSMIEYKLRERKETNKNIYTTYRDIEDIIYNEFNVKSKEEFKDENMS